MLEEVLSAYLSCLEKKKKSTTRWRMSKMVLTFCRKSSPFKRLVRLVMIIERSLIKISQLLIGVQLLHLAFLNVDSLQVFECPGLVLLLKLFAVLTIRFCVSPLLKQHALLRLYQWGYQWLFLRNAMDNIASSFRFPNGGLSIMVGI